jgi:steroid delta-isomerase-like uncharacterized protein
MTATPQTDRQALVQREIDIWNDGAFHEIEAVYAPDLAYTDPMGEVHDRASLREYVEMTLTAFPDFTVQPRAFVETGDDVACRYTFGGTMEGPFRGFEPTGASFELHGISWSHLVDDAVVEVWNATNTMAMARQLGLLD